MLKGSSDGREKTALVEKMERMERMEQQTDRQTDRQKASKQARKKERKKERNSLTAGPRGALLHGEILRGLQMDHFGLFFLLMTDRFSVALLRWSEGCFTGWLVGWLVCWFDGCPVLSLAGSSLLPLTSASS